MNELNLSLQNSAWIDGFSCRVYVRPDAILEICDFTQNTWRTLLMLYLVLYT
jgi:hypothetical protein